MTKHEFDKLKSQDIIISKYTVNSIIDLITKGKVYIVQRKASALAFRECIEIINDIGYSQNWHYSNFEVGTRLALTLFANSEPNSENANNES